MEQIDKIDDGIYAYSCRRPFTDVEHAYRSDCGIILIIADQVAIVIYATVDGNFLETYDNVEDAIKKIREDYGKTVLEELLSNKTA